MDAPPKLDKPKVDAKPTKDLILGMLTRDVKLVSAVLDLVDNSVDGARRLHPEADPGAHVMKKSKRFHGRKIELEVKPTHFQIKDNCGGMDGATLKEQAFRFGRLQNDGRDPSELGAFGVGMKRAIFKFGKHLTFRTSDGVENHTIDVNLKTWADDDDDWEFPVKKTATAHEDILDGIGTTIRVDDLHPDVQAQFDLTKFQNQVHGRIAAVHMLGVNQGLKIKYNGDNVEPPKLQLKQSREIEIGHAPVDVEIKGLAPVTGRIYVGLASSGDPSEDSGWSIYCNDRLLLRGDQSKATGWGDGLPKWHPQYAPFRGYVILYSTDSRALPWNTTKDGLDESSAVHRALKDVMVEVAKPVKRFIDSRKKELDNGGDKLKKIADAAPLVSLFAVDVPERPFSAPIYRKPRSVKMDKIVIRRPVSEIQEAKERLVDLHELGEPPESEEAGNMIFDYFYGLEVGDAEKDD